MSLYGRESELAELAEVIESARRGKGRALRLTGEAGIGKSALLADAISDASGVRVLKARALEAELGLPFAVIKDLVDPLVGYLDEVPPVQKAALEGALAIGPPTPGDRFAAYAGLVSLLAAAAADEPLLLVVDDIQWADRAGAEALLYASRRIANDPIVILVGQRVGEPEPLELSEIPELRVEGLDAEAARTLLAEGKRQIEEEITEQILTHAHGNPLALIEIPGTLTDEQLSGAARLPVPLTGGARIEELFGRLLERELDEDDRHAVGVAALSMAGDSASIRGALTELDLDEHALERAEATNILRLSPSRIAFRHPLLRSAAAASLDPAETRAAHQALANALTVADLVERAYHRVRAAEARDEELAQELEAAGGQSMAQGAHAVAADLLSCSVEVSEEPPAAIGRGGQAAMAAFLAGDLPGAKRSLEGALAADPPDPIRAHMEHQLGTVTFVIGDTAGALSLLETAGNRTAEPLPMVAAPMLADAALFSTAVGDCRTAVRLSALAHAAGERSQDPATRANASAQHAHTRALRGVDTRRDVAVAADALKPLAAPASPHAMRLAVLGACAINDGRRAAAVKYVDGLITQARASASLSAIPYALAWSGHAHSLLGDVERGLAQLSESLGNSLETGQGNIVTLSLALRAWSFAIQGSVDAAADDANWSIELEPPGSAVSVFAGRALGFVDISRGDQAAASARLGPLLDYVWTECGMEHPGLEPVAPLLVEAQVGVGRAGEAASVHATYLDQCERSQSPVGWAYASRGEGLLAKAASRPSGDHFLASVERFEELDDPFEAARSRLFYGESLANEGRQDRAVEQLGVARNTFGELGASLWRGRTERTLAGLGVQVRARREGRPALTPHERQVADFVVDGMKNDEIAEQLFVTRRTVESHLTSVYRKLGIERRTQLARALRPPGRVASG